MGNFILALYTLTLLMNNREPASRSYLVHQWYNLSGNFRHCMNESHIARGEFKTRVTYDPRARCVLACAMEKDGIMIDGKIDKFRAMREFDYAVRDQDREAVVKIIDQCVEDVIFEKNTDCDNAYEVVHCSFKEFKALRVGFGKNVEHRMQQID